MTTFASAIAAAMHGYHEQAASVSHRPDDVRKLFLDANAAGTLARAVLATDEMQAVRDVLYRELARHAALAAPNASVRDVRTGTGLHEHVIAWVLRENS